METIAKYYQQADGYIICQLCPRECKLHDGQIGSCGVRFAENNTLKTGIYANPIALNTDPVEKKPLYHFYPGKEVFSIGTVGCLLHCKNCQNFAISQKKYNEVVGYPYSPEAIVKEARLRDCMSIAYTYNEPFAFYEYMFDTAQLAQFDGLKNIIVSSGYVNEKPLRDLLPFIDAANIDLKCFSDATYKNISSARLKPVLRTLEILKEEGIWVEITNLLIPGYTDDLEMIKLMCGWLTEKGFENTPIHFSRFFPMYKMENVPHTPIDTMISTAQIAKEYGMKYIYLGNVRNSNYENTICPSCHNILIERNGYSIGPVKISGNKCRFCGEYIHGRF